MARPMSPKDILEMFERWGLKVEEVDGWRHHNRNSVGSWGPVNGVMFHHTAGSNDAADERVLVKGRADLPGPLCHWGVRDDGTVVLIGNGRANHAGRGSKKTYDRVVAEDYDGELEPGYDNMDGNRHFYGVEVMYSGKQPPTDDQYDAMCKIGAAVCDFYGWKPESLTSHREWTKRKWDPGHVDMKDFRKDVGALLKGGPDWGTKLKPEPKKKEVDWESFPGKSKFRVGEKSNWVTLMDEWLVAVGADGFHDGRGGYNPGPTFTRYTVKNVRYFQKHILGDPAEFCDGYLGPLQWEALWKLAKKKGWRPEKSKALEAMK